MEPTNRWQMSSDEESDGIAALCGAPDSQASIRSASPPLHPIKPGAPLVFRPIASALRARMQQDIKEQPSAGAVVEPLQQAAADVALATSESDAETIPWCVSQISHDGICQIPILSSNKRSQMMPARTRLEMQAFPMPDRSKKTRNYRQAPDQRLRSDRMMTKTLTYVFVPTKNATLMMIVSLTCFSGLSTESCVV
jgi:hypothetical protein